MNTEITCPDELYDYLRFVLKKYFRGGDDLVRAICALLIEMPNRPIDLTALHCLLECQGFDMTENRKKYVRDFLVSISTGELPVRFILPSKTHFVFFNDLTLTHHQKLVRTAFYSSYIHLSEETSLPPGFNILDICADVDRQIIQLLQK